MLKPMKMKPSYKNYLWGGDSIRTVYGKETTGYPIAESWEVSSRKECISLVSEGEYKGFSINDLTEKFGNAFCGETIKQDEKFPLLLKILDARDNLSVQVHPDDDYAYKNENGEKGKTEAWYILKANDGASLYYGFKDNVSKKDLENAIIKGNVENILNRVECKKGDVFYIPAGTVHAVGSGLLIAEIQQNSDTTYRVFDYNRTDANGKKRELHIEKALDVLDFSPVVGMEKTIGEKEIIGSTAVEHILCNKYFAFEKLTISDSFEDNTRDRLIILFIAEGSFKTGDLNCKSGDSILIPAETGKYLITGKGEILKFYVPSLRNTL